LGGNILPCRKLSDDPSIIQSVVQSLY